MDGNQEFKEFQVNGEIQDLHITQRSIPSNSHMIQKNQQNQGTSRLKATVKNFLFQFFSPNVRVRAEAV
jgi:hypothetical protein